MLCKKNHIISHPEVMSHPSKKRPVEDLFVILGHFFFALVLQISHAVSVRGGQEIKALRVSA